MREGTKTSRARSAPCIALLVTLAACNARLAPSREASRARHDGALDAASPPARDAGSDGTVASDARRCPFERKPVVLAMWSPDGATFVTVAASDEPASTPAKEPLDVWSGTTGAHVRTLAPQPQLTGRRARFAWSADGRYFLSAGHPSGLAQQTVFWDTATWSPHVVDEKHNWTSAVVVSANGRRAAVVGAAGQTSVFDLPSGRVVQSTGYTESHRDYRVALTADGETLLTNNADYMDRTPDDGVSLTRVGTRKELAYFDFARTSDGGIPMFRDRLAVVNGKWAGIVDARTGRRVRAFVPARLPQEPAMAPPGVVAWSPDGARVLFAEEGKDVQIWDAATGRRVGTAPREGALGPVSFSPDSRYALLGAEVWDIRSASLAWKLPTDKDAIATWTGDREIAVLSAGQITFLDGATGAKGRAGIALGETGAAAEMEIAIRPGGRVALLVVKGALRFVRLRDGAQVTVELLLDDGRATPISWRADGAFDGPASAWPCESGGADGRATPGLVAALLAE